MDPMGPMFVGKSQVNADHIKPLLGIQHVEADVIPRWIRSQPRGKGQELSRFLDEQTRNGSIYVLSPLWALIILITKWVGQWPSEPINHHV